MLRKCSKGFLIVLICMAFALAMVACDNDNKKPVEPLTVTEALALPVDELTKVTIQGTVVGYGINGTNAAPLIIEDPANGNAIELYVRWPDVKVGDSIIFSGAKANIKDLPRIINPILEDIVSEGNALKAPTVIEDLEAWAAGLVDDHSNYYGRYTFTARLLNNGSNYANFTLGTAGNNILQVSVYKPFSAYSPDWTVGSLYSVTALMLGISEEWENLATHSITMRLGIMSEDDVTEIIEEIDPVVGSVTDALEASIGAPLEITGTVIGYGRTETNASTALIIEDPTNGKAIELWTYWEDVKVGDSIVVSGIRREEKGLPRIGSPSLIEIVSSDNDLTPATDVSDLDEWATSLAAGGPSNYFGRYTFTGTMVSKEDHSSGAVNYAFFTVGSVGNLRIGVYALHSVYNPYWEAGEEYTITAVMVGISHSFLNIPNAIVTTRLSIMSESDVITDAAAPVDPLEGAISVTEALAMEEGEAIKVQGVVFGFARDGEANRHFGIEDPANGKAIEMWSYWSEVEVGDLIVLEGYRTSFNGNPRINGGEGVDRPNLVAVVSKGNELYPPTQITNLEEWADSMAQDNSNYLGRYTFTATTLSNTNTNYTYFTFGASNTLRVAVHTQYSVYQFQEDTAARKAGVTYTVTVVALSTNSNWSTLPTAVISRFYIMSANDVTLHND